MQPGKSWSEFFPNPFARANPFALLRAQPGASPAQLSALAADRQFLAETTEQQLTFRDALRELTGNPLRRVEWETFTPQAPPPPENESASSAGRLLGEYLNGGRALPGTLTYFVETLAANLGWDRRVARFGASSPTAQEAAQWWQKTTHRHAHRWEFWQQLALVYHALAWETEKVVAEHEGKCSQGRSSPSPGTIPLAGLWSQAFCCWSHTLRSPEFWGTLREHVCQSPGFDAAQFDLLQSSFPERLVSSLAELLLQATAAGNRLAAARRWRLLASLAEAHELSPFAEQAAAAMERVANRLWVNVHQLDRDARARFKELTGGLLLLEPQNPEVVESAFEALFEVLSSEVALSPGEFPESHQASRLLVRHVSALENRVFNGTSDLKPEHSQNDATLLVLFYRLRLSDHGGLVPGEPISKYELRRQQLQAQEQ